MVLLFKKNSNWFACPIYFTSGLLLTNSAFLFDVGSVWCQPSDIQFRRFLSKFAMHGGRAGEQKGKAKAVKTKGCDREHEEHEALVQHYQVGWVGRNYHNDLVQY